jgi:hypothetical protein
MVYLTRRALLGAPRPRRLPRPGVEVPDRFNFKNAVPPPAPPGLAAAPGLVRVVELERTMGWVVGGGCGVDRGWTLCGTSEADGL